MVQAQIAEQGLRVAHAAFAAAWPLIMQALDHDTADEVSRENMRSIEREFARIEQHLRFRGRQ